MNTEKASERFLFATLVSVYFFSGGVFLTFSAPLVLAVSMGTTYSSVTQVVHLGIFNFWAPVFKELNASMLLFSALFFSLVLGLILEPIDRTLSKFTVALFERVIKDASPRHHHLPGQEPPRHKTANNHHTHARYLSWLMCDRNARAHWEWELFLYHLRWSLCTNAVIFIGLYTWLVHAALAPLELVAICAIPIVLFLLYGFYRSRMIAAVNEMYWAKCVNVPVAPAPQRSRPSGYPGDA